jgi:NAD-reducing hydrogenase large subunit
VNAPLSKEDHQWFLEHLPEAKDTIRTTIDLFKTSFDCEARSVLGEFESMYMGLVAPGGKWEHYDGLIRIVDQDGGIVVEGHEPAQYQEIIHEASEPWTYLKFPHYVPMGYPEGMYRVGPLGRVNVCESFGTPQADAELEEFRTTASRCSGKVFDYHYTRLLEILAALERMEVLLADERILAPHVRAEAGINELEGVGIHEAPRGTLIHHYKVDENGLIERANFIVSTGHNNLAMNRAVRQIAETYISKGHVTEGILNRIEGGIRAYDPCLSCSVHAVGQMPIELTVLDPDGSVLETMTQE